MSLPDRLSTANKNPDRREEYEQNRRGGEEEVGGGTAVSVYGSFGCHALLNSRGRRGPFKRSERIVLLHGKVHGSRAGWRDLGRRFRIALKPTPMHQRSGRRAFRHIHNRLGAAGFDSLRVRHGDRRACPPDRRRILAIASVTVNALALACTLPTAFVVLSRYGADAFAVAFPVPVSFATALVGAGADLRKKIKAI